jgi:hypothetical protein
MPCYRAQPKIKGMMRWVANASRGLDSAVKQRANEVLAHEVITFFEMTTPSSSASKFFSSSLATTNNSLALVRMNSDAFMLDKTIPIHMQPFGCILLLKADESYVRRSDANSVNMNVVCSHCWIGKKSLAL